MITRWALFALGLFLFLSWPESAQAQEKFVKVSNLADYNFGLVNNLAVDRVIANSLCVYSAKATPGYNVIASGSGSGGAFSLQGIGGSLAYEAQWSASPNAISGITLTPNVPLTGLITSAQQANCNSGPPSTASLIIILRAIALQSAPSGSFSGSLTVIVGSE